MSFAEGYSRGLQIVQQMKQLQLQREREQRLGQQAQETFQSLDEARKQAAMDRFWQSAIAYLSRQPGVKPGPGGQGIIISDIPQESRSSIEALLRQRGQQLGVPADRLNSLFPQGSGAVVPQQSPFQRMGLEVPPLLRARSGAQISEQELSSAQLPEPVPASGTSGQEIAPGVTAVQLPGQGDLSKLAADFVGQIQDPTLRSQATPLIGAAMQSGDTQKALTLAQNFMVQDAQARRGDRSLTPFEVLADESGRYSPSQKRLAKWMLTRQQQMGGQFVTFVSPTGDITGAWNPKTNTFIAPPVRGGRKSAIAAGSLEKQAALESLQSQIQQIRPMAEKAKDQIGPVAGRFTITKIGLVGADQNVTDLYRTSESVADSLLRARSGAQINEQEFVRLRKLVPVITDPYPTFIKKLDSFQRELDTLMKAREAGGVAPPSARKGRKTVDFTDLPSGRK